MRLVRPEPRSLPVEAALEEARRLVEAGFREIVLCGIHLGLYGHKKRHQVSFLQRNRPWHGQKCGFLCKKDTWCLFFGGLEGLVEALLRVPGTGRLRLSSLEPMEVSPGLLSLMAAEPDRLCPHLHLPLQSGDDDVLRRMGRPYTSADYLAVLVRVRRALTLPAVTTDVLVGFPGETGAAFENTLRVLREARVARVHVFPFSRRPGTPAAAMADQVPAEVIRRRRARAAELGETLARAYRESLIGRTAEVVIERVRSDGWAEGLSERYVRVRIAPPLGTGLARRDLVAVRIQRAAGDWLEAEPAEP